MTERAEAIGALDVLYAAALNDFAWTSDMLGNQAAADDARRRATMTRDAFEALWDETRGIYVDAADERGRRVRVSQQTNAAAIISGCAPAARWSRMLDYILDERRIRITPTIANQPSAYFSQQMIPSEYVAFDDQQHVVAAQPFVSHFVH